MDAIWTNMVFCDVISTFTSLRALMARLQLEPYEHAIRAVIVPLTARMDYAIKNVHLRYQTTQQTTVTTMRSRHQGQNTDLPALKQYKYDVAFLIYGL